MPPSLRSRYILLVVLSTLTFLTSAWAEDWPSITPEELSMTSVPEQPGAAAIVLLREEVTNDPQNNRTVYMRIKVLTEPGRKYADVEIPYSRRNFTISDVSGRTIHRDGSIVPFTGKPFDKVIVRRRDRGKEQRYQVKSFTLPDVQVGSIVEYKYRLGYSDHSFYAPDWEVQTELFQKKATFKFIPYPGLLQLAHDRVGNGVAWTSYLPNGSQLREHEILHSSMTTRRTPNGYIDLEVTNMSPLVLEPYMPPPDAIRYRVNFYYLVGTKQEQFWKDEGKFWNKDVDGFLNHRNGVNDAVSQTVSSADTPEQKARKIYAYVTKLDNWSYQPKAEQEERALGIKADRGAEDVMRQHGGFHDDLNRLYAAMLRAAGVPAWMMWVPARDREFFQPEFLSTQQLAAEIVIARMNDKEVFLDPGTKFCPYGLMDWRYSGVKGIRQQEGKGTEIAQSGLPSYQQSMIQRLARVKMTSDGRAEGTVKIGYYGQEAMERRRDGGKTDAEGRKKLLEDEMKSWLPGDSDVKLTNAGNWDVTEGPLAAEFTISSPLAVGAGKRWMVPAHLFQVNEKPRFSATNRMNAIYFDYLSREIDEVHITMPAELEVESVPPNDDVRTEYAIYRTTQKQEPGNSIVTVRDLAIGGLAFSPQVYKDVKGFFDKVKAGDEQPVVAKAAAHAELK